MRGPRTWLLVLALSSMALVLAWPSIARAAARVSTPAGWHESHAAAHAAQRRAGLWNDTLGLTLVQVVSSSGRDHFAETAAVFERASPVPERAFADDETALAELSSTVTRVVGSTSPEQGGLRVTSAGLRVAWGRWIVDDLAYECVLAPSGDTATVVVMVVLARELDEHRGVLDQIIAELEGVSAPMPRFSLLAWRVGPLLVWLLLGLALHATMLRLADQEDDHAGAGRRASLVNLGLVVVGTALARLVLGGREMAIEHAGANLDGLTMWVALAGIIVVGAHFLAASRVDRGVVQSAPASGAFASGTYSTSGVRVRITDLAESSGSWPRSPERPSEHPPASAPGHDAGAAARIIIDEAERE